MSGQYLGPTWVSRRATEALRAMEMVTAVRLWLSGFHSTPTLSRVSVKSLTMSVDVLVKKYRGYA